jgi:hypothetical protein
VKSVKGAFAACELGNLKSEARNSKQIQMTKAQNSKQKNNEKF